jgi:hypothetical protein
MRVCLGLCWRAAVVRAQDDTDSEQPAEEEPIFPDHNIADSPEDIYEEDTELGPSRDIETTVLFPASPDRRRTYAALLC